MPNNRVPDWAMHVRSAPVDLDWTPAQVAKRLEHELGGQARVLRSDHLPPEQMGLVAVKEIENGRFIDASLWLAIASYRYHQEVFQAAHLADTQPLRADVNRKALNELIIAEIKQYARLGFEAQLENLRARIYGQDEKQEALEDQLSTLGKTSAIDRASLRDAMWQLRPEARVAAEGSHYPALEEAFRQQLRDDAKRNRKDEHPAFYLAQIPIAALQAEALLTVVGYFEPAVCAGVAAGFPTQRAGVVKNLTAARPQLRANAAATLALAPSAETRIALDSQLAIEGDDDVKLAIAYALIHHGATEHMVTLTTALQTCQAAKCKLPVMFADWLPMENKLSLEQATLARILRDGKTELRAHRFATITLRDIGRVKALEPAAVEALIVAARRKDDSESWARAALEALQNATTLSRAEVLERIDRRGKATPAQQQDVLSPTPLLARLSMVALADDLPLLGRLMARFGEEDGPEAELIVEAALRISGEQSDARLINWFTRYKNVRPLIGMGLASRPSVSREQLARLLERADGRTRMIVRLVWQDPNAPNLLIQYMQTGQIQEKLAAAELAGLTGQVSAKRDLQRLLGYRDARYYPSDVLVRHAAMVALVRIAFASSKPATPPAPAAPAAATVTTPAPPLPAP
jgi:hypothetical protein